MSSLTIIDAKPTPAKNSMKSKNEANSKMPLAMLSLTPVSNEEVLSLQLHSSMQGQGGNSTAPPQGVQDLQPL